MTLNNPERGRLETIRWVATAERLPDDNETVLIFGAAIEECWPGYYEDGGWYLADAMPIEGEISYWAPMPFGPSA
jgi:hypothetical protein